MGKVERLLSIKVENKSIHLQDKMEVGSKTSRLLNKLSPYDQKREKEKMLSFYIATTKQLQVVYPYIMHYFC